MRTGANSDAVVKSSSLASKELLSDTHQRHSNDDRLSAEVLERIHRRAADQQADEMFDRLADGKPSRSELSREDVWTRLQQGTVR